MIEKHINEMKTSLILSDLCQKPYEVRKFTNASETLVNVHPDKRQDTVTFT